MGVVVADVPSRIPTEPDHAGRTRPFVRAGVLDRPCCPPQSAGQDAALVVGEEAEVAPAESPRHRLLNRGSSHWRHNARQRRVH